MATTPPRGIVAPASTSAWLLVLVVVCAIAADWWSVGSAAGAGLVSRQWLRLAVVLAVALGLQWWLGPAALPLAWGRARASLRLTGKVVLVGAGVCVVIGLGAVAASRLLGLRWPLQPANIDHANQYWAWFVPAVIWAPLVEEIVYRGIVQARLRQVTGRWVAIGVSGLVFWVYHWMSFEHVTSPHHLGAGLLLAWTYDRSRSLLAPTLLHAIGNLVLGTSDLVYILWPQQVHAVLGWG
jgi:membrane protease YdiL (CAAX protease family)